MLLDIEESEVGAADKKVYVDKYLVFSLTLGRYAKVGFIKRTELLEIDFSNKKK